MNCVINQKIVLLKQKWTRMNVIRAYPTDAFHEPGAGSCMVVVIFNNYWESAQEDNNAIT
jgi:hypothetical protein